MVASFMCKAVTKSYVRLPGSGNDKEAGISFCDLSRGSNLAASIPVPQHVGMPRCQTAKKVSSTVTSTTHLHGSNLAASIPVPQHVGIPRYLTARQSSRPVTFTAATIPVPQHVGMPRCLTATQASSTVTSTTHKRPRNEDYTTESNKRCHIDSTNQNVARNSIELKIKPVTPQGINSNITPTINRTDNEPVKANAKTTKFMTIINTEYVTKLHEENSQLKSENANVKKQVTSFKQFFRNPHRLILKPVSVTTGPVTVSHQGINSNITPTINRTNNEPVKANAKTTKFMAIINTEYDVTKLHEENSQLRTENAFLEKQVSMFKQIFSNPQKLDSVLQRLKENALINPVPAA